MYNGLDIGKFTYPIKLRTYGKQKTLSGNFREVLTSEIPMTSDRLQVKGNEIEFKGSERFTKMNKYLIHYLDGISEDQNRVFDEKLNEEFYIVRIEQVGENQGLLLYCNNMKKGN